MTNKELIVFNLDNLHSTKLGIDRLKRNLNIHDNDIIEWCKTKVREPVASVIKRGKNYYVSNGEYEITIHSKTFTIITARIKRTV